MDIKYFLNNDLDFIKSKLNLETLQKKNNAQQNILHILLFYPFSRSLNKVKYIFDFVKANKPDLFLEKDIHGNTILHFVLYKRYKRYTSVIKYVFDFTKEYPNLFLEKNNKGNTILFIFLIHNDNQKLHYVLDFFKKEYPSLFLEKNNSGLTILHAICKNKKLETIKYIFEYIIRICPTLFIERSNDGISFMNVFLSHKIVTKETMKYALQFVKINFPSLLLIGINNHIGVSRNSIKNLKFFFESVINYCPEKIKDKNLKFLKIKSHLVLPLTFQIQN